MTDELVDAIREVLRARAEQFDLDPATVSSPSPSAITGRTASGELIRLDISTYRAAELAR